MSDAAPLYDSRPSALLDARRDGFGMPRALYLDHALHAGEMAKFWQQGWIFAAFAFEIPNPGDFLTLTVADSPPETAMGGLRFGTSLRTRRWRRSWGMKKQ